MSARTPGPWRIAATNRVPTIIQNASAGFELRDCMDYSDESLHPDAAFIVEACNAHDALTARVAELTAQRDRLAEALDGIVDYITKPDTDDDAHTVTTVLHIAEDARAALALRRV